MARKLGNHWAAWVAGWLVLLTLPAAQADSNPAGVFPQPPGVALVIPAPEARLDSLYAVEVLFTGAVAGVEAADLLVNGTGATNVLQLTPDRFLFTFPQPASGLVAMGWRPDHGITAAETNGLAFSGASWSYTLDTNALPTRVFLSEFMAENRQTLKDEDGDYPDWIELANEGDTPAAIGGWFLTDDPAQPAKWRFPDVSIPGRGFLLVYASEKNKTNAAGRLHANFKLGIDGEYLALLNPATNVVTEFAPLYPRQLADVSYGRAPGATNLGYFVKPTPGALNAATGAGFGPAVHFSQAGGTFTNRLELVLSTVMPQAWIRYTLDGSLPTNSSPLYLKPLVITNSAQVRARAFGEGLLPGPPRSEAYLLLHTNLLGFKSDLPVMVIHTLGKGTISGSTYTLASVACFEPVNGRTSLTNPPVLMTRAGLQMRGSSTSGLPKASFKLECRDEFNLDQDRALLGLPADADWVLYAPNQYEPVLIHNPFIHQLSRDLGRYSPRTRFVEVYLAQGSTSQAVATNTYSGIYVLEEKIKIGAGRVAIDKLQPTDTVPPQVTGGYILKIDRLDPGDSGLSAGGASMVYVDPKEAEIKMAQRRPQQTYIRDYYNAFNKALYSVNWRDPSVGYPAYIDVDSWIDFHVLEVLSGNVDTLALSTYFHKPRNGRIVYGPHWDFDRALGSTDGRDANPRIWSTGPFFTQPWWTRLFTDKDFWQKWVDRWQDLRRTHFSLASLHGQIDRFASEVRLAQPREFAKWRIALRGGSYQAEVNLMKNWVSNRIDFIDKQLTQPPVISTPGGPIQPGLVITLRGPTNATLYYTTDGQDPRASQGAIASYAIRYSGPITIQTNARVVARAYDTTKKQVGGPPTSSSTPWSGPVAETYVVATPTLALSEIMFHPAHPDPGGANSPSDFEFVELKNHGPQALSLPGFTLAGAIQFTFSATSGVTSLLPGQRVVVVNNRLAFQARYPLVDCVAGEFQGSLGNNHNRLLLTGPLGEPVADLTSDDSWAPLADGFGFSLVPIEEGTTNAPGPWRLSTQVGGSPGIPDPAPAEIPPVLVTEVLSHAHAPLEDMIELYNPNDRPVDLSGWYLTDEYRTPAKYRIPEGTFIAPNGWLAFGKSQFGKNRPVGFSFDALGDAAYLFSANPSGALTGYAHGCAFAAAEAGVSFGLHVNSDGRLDFAAEQRLTPGRPNSGPRLGPVILSETLCQTAASNSADAFIELRNLSDAPCALSDPVDTGRAWRLRGVVEFEFPAGTTVPAGGFLLVAGFDPLAEPDKLTAFRLKYHLNAALGIVGPWRGLLAAGQGQLGLYKPVDADLELEAMARGVPGILMDEVQLASQPPWPILAAGSGLSVCRASETILGGDPINWFAGTPSPGWVDSDGDGLPDVWEITYGLDPFYTGGANGPGGDPDGDGSSNYQEYVTAASPWLGPTQLQWECVRRQPLVLKLSFYSLPRLGSTLLSREAGEAAAWEVLQTFPATPQGGPQEMYVSPSSAARFFKVSIP